MINVENYIESQFREIDQYKNYEYIDLYKAEYPEKIQVIFSTVHNLFVVNYKRMNERLPTRENTAHFWADESRNLLFAINLIKGMQRTLKNTTYAFDLDEYYRSVVEKSELFLSSSGGSEIPPYMDKVELYYTVPLFVKSNSIKLNNANKQSFADLKLIGEGSYAKVFSYFDDFYNKKFVLKRALIELDAKELARFKQEFEQMKSLSSPYIVEVYKYDDKNNEYIMEYMDITLDKYIEKNNSKTL